MIFAIHYKALKEAIETPEHKRHVFSHSKISVTPKILKEYEEKIASDPILANYYYPFFQQIHNKLKLIESIEASPVQTSILNDYFKAAQYGGKNLALSTSTELSDTEIELCRNNGIRIKRTPEILSDPGKIGYEPFETHKLSHNEPKSPATIEDFFKNECHLVFYDKHINKDAISLINHLISNSANDSKSIIITSERSPLTTEQIRKSIKTKENQRIRVELADKQTTDLIHDRFIYIDRHYELHFPRGLDVFGCAPDWRNQNATIHIYDVYKCGSQITIGFKGNGRSAPKSIQVRSIING